jgi:exodeoxyribonuclease VII large subunit
MAELLTLSGLNHLVSTLIRDTFCETYWITAEISDVRVQAGSGHCYLEFTEKDPKTNALIAKARGNIWNQTFRTLKPSFEQATGQAFVSGIKVLANVSVRFHELYGYSLTVLNIDPAYTLGDMQRQRQQVLNRLAAEGILDLNKALKFPSLPQRIAVVSSETAAGYEDFLDQLEHNPFGFVFYTRLFPATMQGEKAEESIIAALESIYASIECFDVVVIIRGGGSTSDLHCFDAYPLAAHCAQFPLPVITGIGHERDDTVLDRVANRRAKTPTAVAALLIDAVSDTYAELEKIRQSMQTFYEEKMLLTKQQLQTSTHRLQTAISMLIEKPKATLQLYRTNIQNASMQFVERRKHAIAAHEQFLQLSSPQHILNRGYSVTLKDGKIITSAATLQQGDVIRTIFSTGNVESVVQPTPL